MTSEVEKAWMYLRNSKYNDIVEAEELKEVLYLCGKDATDRQIKTIMKNEGGVITYDRMIELSSEIKAISQDDIMRAFKMFDVNGDNAISLTELKVLLQKLGEKMSPAEVDKIFSSLDTNKDGKLDYGEFTGLYANTTKQLHHLLSIRVSGKTTPSVSKIPTVPQSVTVTETETETETETDTATETDEDDDIVMVTKTPVKSKESVPRTALSKKTDSEVVKKEKAKEKEKVNKKVENKSEKEEKKPIKDEKKLEKTKKTTVPIKNTPAKTKGAEEPQKPDKSKTKDKDVIKTTTKTAKPAEKTAKVKKDETLLKHHRNVRGCTYAGTRGDWTAHQYQITVDTQTRIAILLSPLAQSEEEKLLPDVTLYLVKTNDHSVTMMSLDRTEDNRVKVEGTLEAGSYLILTHTTSCNFVNESSLPVTPVPVKSDGHLSAAAAGVLKNVFHCLDLDGNLLLDRNEFQFFHLTSSGEPLSDSMWDVIKDNFELREDSIPLESFMKLHEMALEDEDGGEEEIRETLTSMGYDEALHLVKALPWHIDLYSDRKVELTVQSLTALTANPTLERAVVRCLEKHGKITQEIEDKCKLVCQTLPWKSTAAIDNMTDKPLRIEVNTIGSENCLENPPYRKHILTVAPRKTMICHHFSPELRSKEFKPAIKIRIVPPPKPK